ncbi:hypothetical protein EDD11_000413 [Mortierella claussenii]|nr:hypothetical protein EDD11_000413 [Mortierella claussenii]
MSPVRSLIAFALTLRDQWFNYPKEMRASSGNARKRASILALGSITYLQKYYASGGIICEGLLSLNDEGCSKASFVDSLSPRSGLMPPSIETLLKNCHTDIQSVLEVWGIISYPSATDGQEQVLDSPMSVDENDESLQLERLKDLSSSTLNTQQRRRYDAVTIDILALFEVSTKAISSIRTYSIHAPGLTAEALATHRKAALAVIDMLSVLEQRSRIDEDDSDFEEYCYARLSFCDLEDERAEVKKYLSVVQHQLFRPQAQRIESQLEQLLIADFASGRTTLPKWMCDNEWTVGSSDEITLEFFAPDTREALPQPSSDRDGFLNGLSDGYVMCMVFNAFIRLTNMPFGLVDKIHEDTARTWRAADNWRFLMQACKFRLEFKVADDAFKPIDIVKRTALGREQLQSWVKLIVQRGIQEAKETLDNKKPALPAIAPTIFF